jgi:Na+/H+ antiporter NhaD/arsenite permease-like protein/S1-C subfamily serine protease
MLKSKLNKYIKSWVMVISLFGLVVFLCFLWQRLTALPFEPVTQAKFVDNPEPALAQVGPSMVSLLAIKKKDFDTQMGLIGCGLIVDSRGYILTTATLTDDIESLYIIDAENTRHEVDIITTDKLKRLTLLKINALNTTESQLYEAAELADFRHVQKGDTILALGGQMTPTGWELTTKTGRITKQRQTLIVEKSRYRDLLQTDIELTSENAGGALVNTNGQVVGMALPSVRPPNVPAFSYAIRADHISNFLTRLPIPHWSDGPSDQVCSWLGAETLPLNPVMAANLSIPKRRGEIVNSLRNNSPSEHAGLRRGDVITSVNGSKITDRTVFDKMAPKLCQTDKIQLSILRDGQEKNITVDWAKPVYALSGSGGLPEVILVVLIFTLMYFFVYKNVFDRVVLFVLGAIVIAITGQHLGFYDHDRMTAALLGKIDILCFIVGMQLVTAVLDEAGALEYMAEKITLFSGGNIWRIMWIFCAATYTFSLFVNNLTTIMLMAPMVLKLSKYLKCDPKPFLASMIIASNLGGASTMVGDFPNMIIGTEAGVPFYQFITYMFPVCLLELFVMLLYLRLARSSIFEQMAPMPISEPNEYQDCEQFDTDIPELLNSDRKFFDDIKQSIPNAITNKNALRRGLIILGVVIAGFLASDYLHCSPAIIALVGGVIALVFGACRPLSLLQKVNIRDILFFSGLFVLVGAAEASGALNYVSGAITHLSFGNLLVLCLLLMWTGAFATCFMNAGPTAAMFLPIVLSLKSAAPHNLYWWSLSLGVCAGSSGTLVGATAGSVTANMVDRFIKKELVDQTLLSKSGDKNSSMYTKMTFHEYASLGFPLMLIFLLISSIYITLIYRW